MQGIYWAIENDVDIINMSFGTDMDSEILHSAIRDAYNAGILLVASSGNNANGTVQYPAAYNEVIAVGATTTSGDLWIDTSTGEELELVAPGEKILTSGFLGGTLSVSGTSIATAEVSAVASLLMQKDTSKSADFIRTLLSASAKNVDGYRLIDYAYASKIYDDFAMCYEESENRMGSFSNEVAPTDYSEITEDIVDGMWGTAGHDTLVDNATTKVSMSTYYTKIVKYACAQIDSVYGNNPTSNLGKIQAFHGRGNYVANIKFVYYFSQLIGQGKNKNTALTTCKRMFPKLLKEESSGTFTYLSNNGDHMLKMANALSEIYNNLLINNNISLYTYKEDGNIGPKRRMLVFLGVMLHMIGDTYAHRTMVNEYTVEGVNPTNAIFNSSTHSDKFGQSDFAKRSDGSTMKSDDALKIYVREQSTPDIEYAYWQDFQQTVRLDVMEFQDVYRFTRSGATKYDDKVSFCKERFSDANKCCISAFNSVISTNYPTFSSVVEFDISFIFPKDDYVKLNNFKNFSDAAGIDVTKISANEWTTHSTSKYV